MNSRGIALAIAAVVLAAGIWLATRPSPPTHVAAAKRGGGPAVPAVTQTGEVVPPSAGVPGITQAIPAGASLATSPRRAAAAAPPVPVMSVSAASAERQSAMVEIDKVHHMITDYHTLMGENPVGTNAEIMKALMGGNAHQATLGPPDGQKLNEKGELVDQWGTPYFFHQLSGDRMEIHSAGPDRIMGTPDDVVIR